jgi:hypothetical protein
LQKYSLQNRTQDVELLEVMTVFFSIAERPQTDGGRTMPREGLRPWGHSARRRSLRIPVTAALLLSA